ncbi:MAG: hypothetical protein ACYDCC_11055 [Actinomycetota bacterium]
MNGVRPAAPRALLKELFDDASLYPPASLPVPDAAAEHEEVRAGEYVWMLAHFVCSASRLTELLDHIETPTWNLTVLLDDPEAIKPFIASAGLKARIKQVEVRPSSPNEESIADSISMARQFDVPIFLEIPTGSAEAVSLIAAHPGVGAKIRCGGNLESMFPSSTDVATTIAACVEQKVRLKATAGLHHAVPYVDKETGFRHHGFLNLLAATAFASRLDVKGLSEILDTEELSFDETGLRVLGEHADANACRSVRELFTTVGSCSFDEPLEDLLDLGAVE